MLADSRVDLTLSSIVTPYPPHLHHHHHHLPLPAYLPTCRVRGHRTATTTTTHSIPSTPSPTTSMDTPAPSSPSPFFLPSSSSASTHHLAQSTWEGSGGWLSRTRWHALHAFSQLDTLRPDPRLASLLRLQNHHQLLQDEEEDHLDRLQLLSRSSLSAVSRAVLQHRAEESPPHFKRLLRAEESSSFYYQRLFPRYSSCRQGGDVSKNSLGEPDALDSSRFQKHSSGDGFSKRRALAAEDLTKRVSGYDRWKRFEEDPRFLGHFPQHGVDWRKEDAGEDVGSRGAGRGKLKFLGELTDDRTKTKMSGQDVFPTFLPKSSSSPGVSTNSGPGPLNKTPSPSRTAASAHVPGAREKKDPFPPSKLKKIQKRRERLHGQKKSLRRGANLLSASQARAKRARPSAEPFTEAKAALEDEGRGETVPTLARSPNAPAPAEDEPRKSFKCSQCRYVTDRKNNLKRHVVTMHHRTSRVLECCGALFHSKASLRDHVSLFHRGGYRCQVCGRNFCRKALLRRHLTVHSGQKDFACRLCAYATSHKSNLERHQRVHVRKTTSLPPTSGPERKGRNPDPGLDPDRSHVSPSGSEPAYCGETEQKLGSRRGNDASHAADSTAYSQHDQDRSPQEHASEDSEEGYRLSSPRPATALEQDERNEDAPSKRDVNILCQFHARDKEPTQNETVTVAASTIKTLNGVLCSSGCPVNQEMTELPGNVQTESPNRLPATDSSSRGCDPDLDVPTWREGSPCSRNADGHSPAVTELQHWSHSHAEVAFFRADFRQAAQIRGVCFPNRLKETYPADDTNMDTDIPGLQGDLGKEGIPARGIAEKNGQICDDSGDDHDEKENGGFNDNFSNLFPSKSTAVSSKELPVKSSCLDEVCNIPKMSDRFGNNPNENRMKPRMYSRPYRCFRCEVSFAHQETLQGHICTDGGQSGLLVLPLSTSVRRGCIKSSPAGDSDA